MGDKMSRRISIYIGDDTNEVMAQLDALIADLGLENRSALVRGIADGSLVVHRTALGSDAVPTRRRKTAKAQEGADTLSDIEGYKLDALIADLGLTNQPTLLRGIADGSLVVLPADPAVLAQAVDWEAFEAFASRIKALARASKTIEALARDLPTAPYPGETAADGDSAWARKPSRTDDG